MKKALALVLSLLVAFSMFAVAASAASEEVLPTAEKVTIVFKDADKVIKVIVVEPGTGIVPDLVPELEKEFMTEYVDSETGKTIKEKHTFKGWKSSVDGGIHYDSGIPTPTVEQENTIIYYTAEYMVEDYSERQSFWNLIESIFERLNLIFEYFATVFNW